MASTTPDATNGKPDDAQPEPPPSPTKNKAPVPMRAGHNQSDKTMDGYDTGVNYINEYLIDHEHPSFDELTEQDVEEDRLENYLENIFHLIATTNFPTPSGFLVASTKVKYFSYIKNVLKHKFPQRDIWKSEDYWKAALKDFRTSCVRNRTLDPAIEEERKSVLLYRDLSGTRCTAVRAKYLNNKVDSRGVAMGMINEGTAHTIQKAAEFAISRQAIG